VLNLLCASESIFQGKKVLLRKEAKNPIKREEGSMTATSFVKKVLFTGVFMAAAVVLPGCASMTAGGSEKVVVHINEGTDKAPAVLRNVANLLNASPNTKVVVVGHSKGIDFMLDGAKDSKGNPFDSTMQTLKARGVEFRACANTFKARKLDTALLSPDAVIVPSGVAEIATLQAKEGFVYLKP
jgi:intracellular sulfur oxidation DsrE/DsrF family protein